MNHCKSSYKVEKYQIMLENCSDIGIIEVELKIIWQKRRFQGTFGHKIVFKLINIDLFKDNFMAKCSLKSLFSPYNLQFNFYNS